jgi:hypothetical protein
MGPTPTAVDVNSSHLLNLVMKLASIATTLFNCVTVSALRCAYCKQSPYQRWLKRDVDSKVYRGLNFGNSFVNPSANYWGRSVCMSAAASGVTRLESRALH